VVAVELSGRRCEIMAKKNPPDERVIYLALKKVFKGANAGIRQPKAIRKLVEKNQDQQDVADLFRTHNIDTICKTLNA
jgi:hypothetical protein